MSGLDTSDRQEYLDNLGDVIQAAKSAGLSDTDAINTYFRMKDRQLESIAAQKATRMQTTTIVIEGTASALGLIGIFSLILVLLAIERNTRPEHGEVSE
jgi:hypothetical protein